MGLKAEDKVCQHDLRYFISILDLQVMLQTSVVVLQSFQTFVKALQSVSKPSRARCPS